MTILACDLGGTRIKAGIIRNGQVLARDLIDAHSSQGLLKRLPDLVKLFQGLCKSVGIAISDCHGVSVSFPSLVDVASGRILAEYGKYSDAPGINLREWAKSELGLPLAIENDARMALIGEWQYGAGRGCNDAIMITLGTGIGVAAISEGRIIRGKHGQAAVMGGHATVRFGGRRCHCGNIGCAEAEASTAFLAKIAQEHGGYGNSALSHESILDYAAVFKQAAKGDECALALRDHSLQVWSSLVVTLIHTFDPERVILGGGIMASAEVIVPAVQEYVKCHAHTPWGSVKVIASELGDEAGLIAAEWLLNEQFTFN